MASLNNQRYLITPSLLNSWLYIWTCVDGLEENEDDEVCLEDKISQKQSEAFESFLKYLKKEKIEPNKFMIEGIQFEKDTYDGKTCFSEIVKDGAFQIVGKKEVKIDGIDFLMYGKLDVLKGGVIYDIKRVWKYKLNKYVKSAQHGFYLDLFENAKMFKYLIWDGRKPHYEIYHRGEYVRTEELIHLFIVWLRKNKLLKVYKEFWKCKEY